MDARRDLRRIADVIRRTNADIVGLQEVDRNCERTGTVDQPAALSEQLGQRSAFGPAIESPQYSESPGQYGVAVLSRYPIEIAETQHLHHDSRTEPRVLLETRIDIDGDALFFYTTHLGLTGRVRERQAAEIVDLARDDESPAIITGDFNAMPESEAIATLTEVYRDAFAAVGMGDVPTFPSPYAHQEENGQFSVSAPHRRIDYLFCSPEVTVADAVRFESLASDHCPVVADFVFER